MGMKDNIKQFCEQNQIYADTLTTFNAIIIAYKKKLEAIPFYFRHFSRHDASHSEKIIQYLEMLLGEESLGKLSLSDQVMIILAAYSHDIGMALEHKQVEEYFKKADFVSDLQKKMPKGYSDLETIVKEILEFPESVRNCKNSDVLKIYADVSIVVENVFRNGHAKRSSIIIENDENMEALLGIRGAKLLAKICALHDGSIETIMQLPCEENGWFNDYLHPRFLAGMLCLGDLLDLDTDRFDKAALKTSSEMPILSMLHKKKHESIVHYLVKAGRIEIQANCDGYDIYQTLRQWTDWIKMACTFLVEKWDEITPNVALFPPRLKKCDILINGNSRWAGYLDTKIHIDTAKAVKVFEGANIYSGKWTFIRELIQNAVDASLIQLCNDAKYLKENLGSNTILTTEDILSFIKEGKILVNNYDITGRFYAIDKTNGQYELQDKENETVHFREKTVIFELEDHGTGIAEAEIDMIAGLKGKSEKLREKIASFPEFFRPAGIFGIGIQSVFQVASKIEFITKTDDEKCKIITITDPSVSGFVYVEDYNEFMHRGTKARVTMDLSKFTQTDYNCADFFYQTIPKYQLLLGWLSQHMYNMEKESFPGFESQRQTEDYFNISIGADLDESGTERTILQRSSILTAMSKGYLNENTINIKDGQLNYKYYDLKNNCVFDANLFAGMVEFETKSDNKFGRCSAWHLDKFFNRVFYRNVIADNYVLRDDLETYSKNERYIDFKINIFSDNADKILNVGRNKVKEEYREQLKKLIDYEFMIMFKRLIDYCINNKIKEKRILFLAYVASLVYGYNNEGLCKKYMSILKIMSINNYYNLKEDEVSFSLVELRGKRIYFLKELDKNSLYEYPEYLWKDKHSCKNLQGGNNFICLFNIPEKKRMYDRHFLTHFLKGEYFTIVEGKKYIVYEVTPYIYGMEIEAPFRADFIKYREFLDVVLGNSRFVLASEAYIILETPVSGGIVHYYHYNNKRAVEVMLNPIIQKELASVLVKDGYVRGARKYLNRIKGAEEYNKNIDFIYNYHIKNENEIDRRVLEDKYQQFISELLKLLENKNYATYIKGNYINIKHNNFGRNYYNTDFYYNDDYIIKRFIEE